MRQMDWFGLYVPPPLRFEAKGNCANNPMSSGIYKRLLEDFLSDFALNPSFACGIMDVINEFYLEQTKKILEAGKRRIDMVYTTDNIGTQWGVMISYPKNNFRGKISFHGGIDVQQFLPSATKEEVANEVRRLVQILGREGGHILAPAHNIQVDTPVENILAIYN